jgi:ABC-type phosphate/phosphonate transport system substrate-binding protein
VAEYPPVASLPMYDWPEVQWAHDALWSAIAERLNARGIAAPEALDRARPAEEVWRDPGLVLSQTCGWPFATRLQDQVQLVGTPQYAVEGCRGPYYCSMIVVRKGDPARWFSEFKGERAAINSCDSLSGYIAFRAALNGLGGPPSPIEWVETGSHRESLRAIAEGRADIAAIDAVCWALAKEFEAEAVADVRVIAQTALRPGLPYITAGWRERADRASIRQAIAEAMESDQLDAVRRSLFLSGTSDVEAPEYASMVQALGTATSK